MNWLRVGACAALFLVSGCVGTIRETTSPRTSTEQLLVSSAAERAIGHFENVEKELKGRRVAIDDTRFESLDKAYAISALRHYVAEHGGFLVPLAPQKVKDASGKEIDVAPERVLEVRSGALGINDTSFGIGVPPLPLPIPQTSLATTSPPLYLFFRAKQEGWAKFQFWIYDPRQDAYVAKSKDLWGHSYYSKWYVFGFGPFDFSNDIYPDDATLEGKSSGSKEVSYKFEIDRDAHGRPRRSIRDYPTSRIPEPR